MDISVIIPTYKPKAYLWECLDSVCAQTIDKAKVEVILVLNGCCDPYNSEIKEYLQQHPEINWNYIQTDTPGVSNARNLALDVTKGKYITFLDDDDYLSPSCLEEMLSLQNGDIVVECYPFAFSDDAPGEQINYGLTDVYTYCTERHCNKLNSHARKFFSGPCMKLIPRSYIRDLRFNVDFTVGEDSLFMFAISDKIRDIAYTSKDAVYYRRRRENSATKSTKRKRDVWKLNIRSIGEYVHLYKPCHHSAYFFASRIAACLISMVKIRGQRPASSNQNIHS